MLGMSLLQCGLPISSLHKKPLPGQKIQNNISSFTVNANECLVLTDWPSERVHCEKRSDGSWNWIVEHFDDAECKVPNAKAPVINHTASGCVAFPATNHSYNDRCNDDGTITVSRFSQPGCIHPMPTTPFNFNFKA